MKNNRAPLLCCFKLCASFHSHRWIQTKVTVPKRSIRVKIGDLLSRVTFKFDGWHWKTIGHLYYVASSFMHHFITIGEFKLKLQSGNAQFGSKSAIFVPYDLEIWRMTLKKKGTSSMLLLALCSISYPLVNSNWSYSPETPNLGQIQWFLEPCDFEIRQITLKNNRTPLLCYFKLCAAFRTHWWIQTGVTVRKRPIWVKFDDF